MGSNIKIEIEKYLEKYPPALELFKILLKTGEVYAVGGMLREFKDNGKIIDLRDADFSVHIKNREMWNALLEKIPYTRNNFGGYKFLCSGFIIDVWNVKETWAFRENIIEVEEGKYFEKLAQSVFLNVDAIVYDFINDRWNDMIYQQAMEKRELGVVLKSNPFVELNILRAMVLRKRYEMFYSNELKDLIATHSVKNNFCNILIEMQKRRYKKYVLPEEDILHEIELCKD